MENTVRGLKLAAAVIITAVVIGMAFRIFGIGMNMTNKGLDPLTEFASEAKYEDVLQLENTTISGAQVVTLSERYKATVPVVIETKLTNTLHREPIYDKSFIRDESSESYVNPVVSFNVEVDRSENFDLPLICFIQEGVNKSDYDYEKAYSYMEMNEELVKEFIEEQKLQVKLKELQNLAEEKAVNGFNSLGSDTKSEEYWNTMYQNVFNQVETKRKGGD